MTSLQRLAIITGPRMSPKQYSAIPVGPNLDTTCHLSRALLTHLRRVPLLDTIIISYHPKPIPSVYDADFEEPIYFVRVGVVSLEPWLLDDRGGILYVVHLRTGSHILSSCQDAIKTSLIIMCPPANPKWGKWGTRNFRIRKSPVTPCSLHVL